MKSMTTAFMLLLSLCLASLVFAGADDTKWVAKCVADNADAKVSPEVVAKYCTCMNNKMDDGETKSISNWEKTHPNERMACEKEAGWK